MSRHKFSILYVDDEEANLRVFKTTFMREYNILTASSGERALKIIRQKKIDLFITDQRMPKMNGVQFLKEAIKICPDPSRILLTGYSDVKAISSAVNEAGIFHYISKPWDKDEMKNIIDRALEIYQLKKEKQKLFENLENALDLVSAQEQRLQLAIEASNQGLWDWKVSTDAYYLSPECYDLIGYRPYEFDPTYTNWLSMVHPDDREMITTSVHQYLEGQVPHIEVEFRILSKNGGYRWLYTKGSVVEKNKNGTPVRMTGIVSDITERKHEQDKVIAAIVETEDKERSRIAKELHDGLGQNLTTSMLNLGFAKKEVSKLSEKSQQKFANGMEFLNLAIHETRNIAHNLMPKTILDFGYVSAIESMMEGLEEVSSIDFVFYNNLNGKRIEESLEVSLYRITQEAVNNILKYSNARKATIQLMSYPDLVMLIIEDDGKGFDPEKLDPKNGSFGINSMKSRAKAIRGTFILDSAPGKGTTITINIPMTVNKQHYDRVKNLIS